MGSTPVAGRIVRQVRYRRFAHRYTPASRMWARPRGEMRASSSGSTIRSSRQALCRPYGMVLRRSAFQQRTGTYQYVARTRDCQSCPIKESCLPPRQKRRFFTLTMYHPVYLRARERNRTAAYRRERRRRHTIVEGIFASLDRLGWEKSRLRGLWKVDCESYMATLSHNVKKLVRRLGRGIGPPDPASPDAGIIAGYKSIMIDGALGPTAPVRYSSSMSSRSSTSESSYGRSAPISPTFSTRPTPNSLLVAKSTACRQAVDFDAFCQFHAQNRVRSPWQPGSGVCYRRRAVRIGRDLVDSPPARATGGAFLSARRGRPG